MAKRTKKAPAGAPLWVVSYGDMMSLLLTFFIMLASLANFDDIEKFNQAVQSIREALGMKGQVGRLTDQSIDYASLLQKLESVIKPIEPRNRGDSEEEGIYGKNFRLRRIRDGMEITIGGPILFDPFSDKINEQGKETLEGIGESLKGHRNKIEIRGHAAEEPRPSDWTYADAVKLSFARAERIADELVLRGVDPRTLRLVAVGPNEPVARGVYDPTKRGENRRVEIIVRESLIDDYVGPASAGNATASQPATSPAIENGSTRPG